MSPSRLAELVQDDWSAGGERDVAPHLIDPRGFLEGRNALLENDGSIFKRGGSVAKSAAAFGSSMSWVYDVFLRPGRRTLVANASDFGVLAVDDTTVVNLGDTGLAAPTKARVLAELAFIGGGKIYGGSRKAANYTTGTIAVTQGSPNVVGTGTLWSANVDAGMLIRDGNNAIYVVDTVTDNTNIILNRNWQEATGSGFSYAFKQIDDAAPRYPTSPYYAVAGNRLLAAVLPNIVKFSNINDATHLGPHTFGANDYHTLPEGVQILGMAGLSDEALIFTTQGLWILSGLTYDLVNLAGGAQQSMSQVSEDLLLWDNAGVSSYQGALVCPMLDSIYLIDPRGNETNVGKGIRQLYQHYVSLGYRPGKGATYRNHLFLPILDAVNGWIDTLVCRLDRPVRSRGQTLWPFTQMDNAGGKVTSFEVRSPASETNETPKLLAANADGYLTDLSGIFEPSSSNSLDHDGVSPDFDVVTRDLPTADGLGYGRARKVELLYEMFEVVPGDNPQIAMDLGIASPDPPGVKWDEVTWDDFNWETDAPVGTFEALEGTFGPDIGVNKGWWLLSRAVPYVRFRIRSSDPVAKLTIRALILRTAEPANNRRTQIPNLANA